MNKKRALINKQVMREGDKMQDESKNKEALHDSSLDNLSFRRKLAEAPKSLDNEMLAYLKKRPTEKETVKEARHFDKQIDNALQVKIPEGLQARILLKQSLLAEYEVLDQAAQSDGETNFLDAKVSSQTVKDRSVRPWQQKIVSIFAKQPYLSAIAAGVFTLSIGLMAFNHETHEHKFIGSDEIVLHVLEHLNHEPGLLDELLMPDTDQDMQQLFASVGATLNQPVEGMEYAGICDIEGQDGLHIVMEQDNKPVTIIVMPGQQLAAAKAFEKSGYKGELVPVKGGMVAIVGDSMEQVALAQIRFFRAVRFV